MLVSSFETCPAKSYAMLQNPVALYQQTPTEYIVSLKVYSVDIKSVSRPVIFTEFQREQY